MTQEPSLHLSEEARIFMSGYIGGSGLKNPDDALCQFVEESIRKIIGERKLTDQADINGIGFVGFACGKATLNNL